MLIDISLSTTPTISSISFSLHTLFYPLLGPSPSTNNSNPTLNPPQKRLRELYETTLKPVAFLTLSLKRLTGTLSDFAVTLVADTADSAAANFSKSLACCSNHTPRASFQVARESARRLTALFITLTLKHEEREWMSRYVSKIFVLLRVIESYFSPQSKHRHDIFGNPGQWNGHRGFPIIGVGVFDVREIGGILAGILGAEIVLKVGVTVPGVAVDVLVEKRVRVLKRCLVLIWEKEVALVEKAKWLGSPKRAMKVTREAGEAADEGDGKKEKGTAAPTDNSGTVLKALDWKAQVVERVFQAPGTGKASSVAKELPKTPADDSFELEKVGLGTGRALVARDGSRVTAPDNWEVHAAKRVLQAPWGKGGLAEEVKTLAFADREAVQGGTVVGAVQVELAQMGGGGGGEGGEEGG